MLIITMPLLPLSSTKLRQLLRGRHGSHFLGIYPIDRLPKTLPHRNRKGSCFIVNTDPSHLPGTHWLAVYVGCNLGEVFDSYGRPPPLRLQQWLAKHCRSWVYNKRFVKVHSLLYAAFTVFFYSTGSVLQDGRLKTL